MPAQTIIRDVQQSVGIWWQIDTDHICLFVGYVIDEIGVLVREAIVILAPHVRTQQMVQRGNRQAPWNLSADFQLLGVLAEHRVDDVNERLVTGGQTVATGQEIALEPTLTGMLAQDLHHATVRREMIILGEDIGPPGAICRVEQRAQAVSSGPMIRKLRVS